MLQKGRQRTVSRGKEAVAAGHLLHGRNLQENLQREPGSQACSVTTGEVGYQSPTAASPPWKPCTSHRKRARELSIPPERTPLNLTVGGDGATRDPGQELETEWGALPGMQGPTAH